jgi:hypothetical protein
MFQLEHSAHMFRLEHSLDFDKPNPASGAAPVHDPGLSIVNPFDG